MKTASLRSQKEARRITLSAPSSSALPAATSHSWHFLEKHKKQTGAEVLSWLRGVECPVSSLPRNVGPGVRILGPRLLADAGGECFVFQVSRREQAAPNPPGVGGVVTAKKVCLFSAHRPGLGDGNKPSPSSRTDGGRRQISDKGPTEHHQGARKTTLGGTFGILGLDLVCGDANSFKRRTTDGVPGQNTDGAVDAAAPGPLCRLPPPVSMRGGLCSSLSFLGHLTGPLSPALRLSIATRLPAMSSMSRGVVSQVGGRVGSLRLAVLGEQGSCSLGSGVECTCREKRPHRLSVAPHPAPSSLLGASLWPRAHLAKS